MLEPALGRNLLRPGKPTARKVRRPLAVLRAQATNTFLPEGCEPVIDIATDKLAVRLLKEIEHQVFLIIGQVDDPIERVVQPPVSEFPQSS